MQYIYIIFLIFKTSFLSCTRKKYIYINVEKKENLRDFDSANINLSNVLQKVRKLIFARF